MLHTFILKSAWRVSRQASHRVIEEDNMEQEGCTACARDQNCPTSSIYSILYCHACSRCLFVWVIVWVIARLVV